MEYDLYEFFNISSQAPTRIRTLVTSMKGKWQIKWVSTITNFHLLHQIWRPNYLQMWLLYHVYTALMVQPVTWSFTACYVTNTREEDFLLQYVNVAISGLIAIKEFRSFDVVPSYDLDL